MKEKGYGKLAFRALLCVVLLLIELSALFVVEAWIK